MRVTPHNPHRTGRALLTHTALQMFIGQQLSPYSHRLSFHAFWPLVPACIHFEKRTFVTPFAPSALPEFDATMKMIRLLSTSSGRFQFSPLSFPTAWGQTWRSAESRLAPSCFRSGVALRRVAPEYLRRKWQTSQVCSGSYCVLAMLSDPDGPSSFSLSE